MPDAEHLAASAEASAELSFDDPAELRRYVDSLPWYHTIEVAPGVETPGFFDHRPIVKHVPLPGDLHGARCLDVGTFDGFWAFEMERRGAEEVVAIDILDPLRWDWPVGSDPEVIETLARRKRGGEGYTFAHRMLDSSVSRIERSVYDLDPDEVGHFDLVFVGSILMALRDPAGALARVREVCRGRLVIVDNIQLPLTLAFPRLPMATLDGVGRPWWWKPNVAALERLAESAGFEATERPRRVFIPSGRGEPPVRPSLGLLTRAAGWEALIRTRWGDPHAALALCPR